MLGSASLINGEAAIVIPEHFEMVTVPEGLTVQLTPRGAWLQLFAESLTPGMLKVRDADGRSGTFDYFIQGVRKGYENEPVIRDRRVTGGQQ